MGIQVASWSSVNVDDPSCLFSITLKRFVMLDSVVQSNKNWISLPLAALGWSFIRVSHSGGE